MECVVACRSWWACRGRDGALPRPRRAAEPPSAVGCTVTLRAGTADARAVPMTGRVVTRAEALLAGWAAGPGAPPAVGACPPEGAESGAGCGDGSGLGTPPPLASAMGGRASAIARTAGVTAM